LPFIFGFGSNELIKTFFIPALTIALAQQLFFLKQGSKLTYITVLLVILLSDIFFKALISA
jgi:hypothetical protein